MMTDIVKSYKKCIKANNKKINNNNNTKSCNRKNNY